MGPYCGMLDHGFIAGWPHVYSLIKKSGGIVHFLHLQQTGSSPIHGDINETYWTLLGTLLLLSVNQ